MTTLPEKPDAVAHVSDVLWEAALLDVLARFGHMWPDDALRKLEGRAQKGAADFARCLILLGEVVEPVDPISVAIRNSWREYRALSIGRDDSTARDWRGGRMDDQSFCSASLSNFEIACRMHLAGKTLPVQS